jgi:hypothetical protein
MRPPVDTILAPPVPRHLRRVPPARTPATPDGTPRAQVVCFWDVFQPASLRALDYLVAWHERYSAAGLRVVAVHAPSDDAGRDEELITAAVTDLGLPFEVVLDPDFELWRAYENPGWPVRYVLAPGMRLVDVHFGEGGYVEAERAIQELLDLDEPTSAPLRPADAAEALVVVPTEDVAGPYDGPFAAGEVWVVVDGPCTIEVDGMPLALMRIGAHRVRVGDRHATGSIAIAAGAGARVLRTAFGPGLAPDQ